MQKIADTLRGTVLIEMTETEWAYQTSRPSSGITWLSLDEWYSQFINGLDRLSIGPDCYNLVIRAIKIITLHPKTQAPIAPRLLCPEPFSDGDGVLRTFDDWCNYCLQNDPGILNQANLNELRRAIKQRRRNQKEELFQEQDVLIKLLLELYPEGPTKENIKDRAMGLKQRFSDG